MKRVWLLLIAMLFLTLAPPGASVCGQMLTRNACAAETLTYPSLPIAINPSILPEPFTPVPAPPLLITTEPTPRATHTTPSPLQYKEVRARGVPYHSDSPPPYLLPSVSS